MNIENIWLNHYPATTPEMREALWPLRLGYGDFGYVLKDPEIYKTLQVVLAESVSGAIFGWAGIYYRADGLTTIGIFVREGYRHKGLGGRLKDKAISICMEQGKDCFWQDTKAGSIWVHVKPDGTIIRPYYTTMI